MATNERQTTDEKTISDQPCNQEATTNQFYTASKNYLNQLLSHLCYVAFHTIRLSCWSSNANCIAHSQSKYLTTKRRATAQHDLHEDDSRLFDANESQIGNRATVRWDLKSPVLNVKTRCLEMKSRKNACNLAELCVLLD